MGVFKVLGLAIVAALAGVGCTKTINQCNSDSDCKDVAYPFCDLNGQYPASGGETHVCTVVPTDCPPGRCGCTPGAMSCDADQLTTCNSDGMTQSTLTCALGCADTEARCKTFDPSFGLGALLATSAAQPAVVLGAGSTINTDTGVVQDSSHLNIEVMHQVQPQTGGPDIEVFIAGSFQIGSVTVTGSKPIAFVASGTIAVTGALNLRATHSSAGPGAQEAGVCVGAYDATGTIGGGGGNATAGGYGNGSISNHTSVAGGAALPGLGTLVGGCRGGDEANGGGGGGGAIAMASLTSIAVNGQIDVGGGGGATTSGGGSGGNVVLEAPTVTILGAVTANGGGGGACSMSGSDATSSAAAASGGGPCGSSGGVHGGAGGTGMSAPSDGVDAFPNTNYAGGGGAAGKLLIRTLDGTAATGTSTLVSAAESTSMLVLH